jgi:hypothetical protein
MRRPHSAFEYRPPGSVTLMRSPCSPEPQTCNGLSVDLVQTVGQATTQHDDPELVSGLTDRVTLLSARKALVGLLDLEL